VRIIAYACEFVRNRRYIEKMGVATNEAEG
jgi:hypothetical protein